jgi:hypothetical protein
MLGEKQLGRILEAGEHRKLVLSGNVGVKEIDRLIAKLQLDKEILADEEKDEEAAD